MGGSQKLKRVSWATDVNLCQVRLFLSEECPSQVAVGTQDHLQAKIWPLQAGGVGSDDNLPPGFEFQPANPWAVKLSQISLVKWKCPHRFQVDSSWRVVAGEESREIETQNQREMRVLEAIYPRPSAIPLNPSALAGAEDSTNDDKSTPVVPITAIEDEDASLDASYASTTTPIMAQQQHSTQGEFPPQLNATQKPSVGFTATGMEPEIIAAAQAALSSVAATSDQGNLIDRELLLKILSNHTMVEQLIANHAASPSGQNVTSSSVQSTLSSSTFPGMPMMRSESVMPTTGIKNLAFPSSMPSTSTQYIPNMVSPPQNCFDSVNIAVHRREPPLPPSARVTRPEMAVPSFHPPGRTGPMPSPSAAAAAPVTKDLNYYKSLIQQHGGERRENTPQFSHQGNLQPGERRENTPQFSHQGNLQPGERRENTPQFSHQGNLQPGTGQEPPNNMMMKSREPKPKIMKPCIYFNSARGCRNGANCTFQHDVTSQQKVNGIPEVQGTKRVKLDREINGA